MMYDPSAGRQVQSLKQHVAKTFGWMFLGLLATFAVMIAGYYSKIVFWFLSIPAMVILGALEIGTVFFLSARIDKLPVGAARMLFFIYAVLNGLSFSTYFLYFEVPILIISFGVAAVYFGVMAAVGMFTKVDLSRLQPILVGGLIFLIITSIISILFGLSGMEKLLSFIGVAIFLAFTAYDVQKMKAMHSEYSYDSVMLGRASVISALQLYLDFINLFIHILRLLSGKD